MSETLLKIEHLSAGIGEKAILNDINLEIGRGEIHVLMGPNGTGKSTLGYILMGNPRYTVTSGKIEFKGEDITEASADKRAKAGMFLSFQEPLEVPGLPLHGFVTNAVRKSRGEDVKMWNVMKELNANMSVLEMSPSYRDRSLNVGFSGGEKKKTEILQMMMLKPDLAILDETDSGLDVDAVRLVSKGINEFRKDGDKSLLIITHSTRILDALDVDYTHIMVDGHIVTTGDGSLVADINENGYAKYVEAAEKAE